MNDYELVQGLRRRDPAAKQWLCDCYLPSLWRFVYVRVHGNSHLAEDITHETVLAMLTTLQADSSADQHIENPGGWLRTVADRRIADHFRAAARVQHLLQQGPVREVAQETGDPARQHELQETRQEVRQALDSLPDQYRLGLEWKYLDKLSVREIAARWELTEKAAESILFRARRELRERLAKSPSETPSSASRSPASRNDGPDAAKPGDDQPPSKGATGNGAAGKGSTDKGIAGKASAGDGSGPQRADVAHRAT